jgi:hypothetical protein
MRAVRTQTTHTTSGNLPPVPESLDRVAWSGSADWFFPCTGTDAGFDPFLPTRLSSRQ